MLMLSVFRGFKVSPNQLLLAWIAGYGCHNGLVSLILDGFV